MYIPLIKYCNLIWSWNDVKPSLLFIKLKDVDQVHCTFTKSQNFPEADTIEKGFND